MTACLIFVSLLGADTLSASDFFPTAAGTKWVYDETSGKLHQTYTETAEAGIKVGPYDATPITSVPNGRLKGDTAYYRVDGPNVFVVALNPKKALDDPYQILSVSEKGEDWRFSGLTESLRERVGLELYGRSRLGGEKEYLGKKRRTLNVHLEAVIGNKGEPPITMIQDIVYAEGVGLVELKETGIINGHKSQRDRKLVSFTPAGG